jgi:hypothetical protein
MEKVLKVTSLKDTLTDFIYWNSKPESERLKAIETLRQQYINFNRDVQPGFQRVYRVVNQKRG